MGFVKSFSPSIFVSVFIFIFAVFVVSFVLIPRTLMNTVPIFE